MPSPGYALGYPDVVSTIERPTVTGETNELDTRRWRVYLIGSFIVACVLLLSARLVYLQVIEHAHFGTMATAEHWRESIIPPRRGDILDTSGNELATSVTYESLYASTTEVSDPAAVAQKLAPIIGAPASDIQKILSNKQAAPTLIKAWLPDDVATAVEKLGIDGLFLQQEPKRVYPQGNLAAQVLGVVGADNNGLSGLELAYNSELAGKPGKLVAERDTAGDALALGPHQYTAPINGSTLTLTIDRYVQWVAERELEAAVSQHHAKGGSVVVLDPRTGAVLAIAGRPTFQNNATELYSQQNVDMYGIPAVSNAYEPGSIFKIVTMAAALDTGTVTPNTSFFNPGYFNYYGGTIHDAIGRSPGPETMAQTLTYSSNIGVAWAAGQVGAVKFYEYAQRFGIGRPTDIDLPGEASGVLRLPTADDWHPFDLATNSFGQGLSVTPIQMAAAVAAVANGGTLMKPYVVKRIESPAETRLFYPTVVGQVIKPQTAVTLTNMLVQVVDDNTLGESRLARVPGYAVAGKTGTAEIPIAGGYSPNRTIASFAGFAPAENPRFVILVRIDDPQDSPWGETVAAPVFSAIARQLINYYQIPPTRGVNANGT
ncbi:MAG TPA: penicillin-binding protein 2 [Chloroflexota bacterium]|nr:penicillin-binding protein 2 [Chloroflexota bacterium]